MTAVEQMKDLKDTVGAPSPWFSWLFAALCLLALSLQAYKSYGAKCARQPQSRESEIGFKAFQRNYLAVYFCAVMADWLQGPYVYALYEHYGYSKFDIGILFVTGFGSSGVFGAFVGDIADKYGRRFMCFMYCVITAVSCMTKHSQNFQFLLLGRLTGGIATSILFSAFESWMVAEHNKRDFSEEGLHETFSRACVGNGVVAILASFFASVVSQAFGSLVAPFDLAICFLTLGGAIIAATWDENKGDLLLEKEKTQAVNNNNVMSALKLVVTDLRILFLGVSQSCFEGSMYVFIFMWTPRLEVAYHPLPHGEVFGCFMACMVVGSVMFEDLLSKRGDPSLYLKDIYFCAALCLAVPSLNSMDGMVILACFCLFEILCGLYFPSIAVLKSRCVKEEVRTTVYNIFRIPLNVFVVMVLINLETVSDGSIFVLCAVLLLLAGIIQYWFHMLDSPHRLTTSAVELIEVATEEPQDAEEEASMHLVEVPGAH